MLEYIILFLILALCITYVGYRMYRTICNVGNPCDGCAGCALKDLKTKGKVKRDCADRH